MSISDKVFPWDVNPTIDTIVDVKSATDLALVDVIVQYVDPSTMLSISRTFREVEFGDSLRYIVQYLGLFTYFSYNTHDRKFSLCVKNGVDYKQVESFFVEFSKQLKFDF